MELGSQAASLPADVEFNATVKVLKRLCPNLLAQSSHGVERLGFIVEGED